MSKSSDVRRQHVSTIASPPLNGVHLENTWVTSPQQGPRVPRRPVLHEDQSSIHLAGQRPGMAVTVDRSPGQ